MDERLDERLSAWADDELPEAEQELLLRQVVGDPALRARWARYHLIGDALRDGLPESIRPGFAEQVAAAIAREPASMPAGVASPWLRRAGGAAIAASVMVAALMTMRVDEPVGPPEQAVVAPPTANPQVPVAARFAATQGMQWEQARPELQRELNEYLLRHADETAVPADEGDGR